MSMSKKALTMKKPSEKKSGGHLKEKSVVKTPAEKKQNDSHVATLKNFVRAGNQEKGFLAVKTDEKGKVTTANLIAETGMAKEFAKNLLGLKPLRAVLVYGPAATQGSANTAFNTVQSLDATASGEFATWAGIFDEARVLSLKIRVFGGWFNGMTAAGPNITQLAAFCYDPTDLTANTSIERTLEHTKACGPTQVSNDANVAVGTSSGGNLVTMVSQGGMEIHSGPLARGVTTTNNSGTLSTAPVQGNWFPTVSTGAIVGWIKPYVEALGANVQFVVRYMVWYEFEFRMRT
jgi:hypothetical protein